MKDFFLLGNSLYSLKLFAKIKAPDHVSSLRDVLKTYLGHEKGQHTQMVVVGYGAGEDGVIFSHAAALLSLKNHIGGVFYQSQEDPLGKWMDKRPRGYSGTVPYALMHNEFDRYLEIHLFVLEERVISNSQRKEKEKDFLYIMGGGYDEKYAKEKRVEWVENLNKKKSSKRTGTLSNKKSRAKNIKDYEIKKA
jgi:uncharacterized protein YifE (UPF0438 family)